MEEARRRRWYGYGYCDRSDHDASAPHSVRGGRPASDQIGHETLVERQIRLAHERGDFDDLPGKGKPLPGLDGPDDEDWWVKGYLRREGLSSEPLLPTPLQLRREIERLPETLSGLPDEQAVRGVVRELNRRIAEWVRAPVGPAVPVGPVDVDAVVARWHADRTALRDRRAAERRAADAARADRPRRRWWRW